MRIDLGLPVVDEGTWNGVETDYKAYNSGGVEVSVGEFLYGMVRVLKPMRILETGTHQGISATYMGMALRDNGFGKLVTIENVPENVNKANELFNQHKLGKFIDIHIADVRTVELENNFEMLFLDSEPQYRFNELVRFYPHLMRGGFAFIHDLHRHLSQEGNNMPFGKIPDEIDDWVAEYKVAVFNFPTPRGFTGFYKTHGDDHYAPR